jgi:hypothetical protein
MSAKSYLNAVKGVAELADALGKKEHQKQYREAEFNVGDYIWGPAGPARTEQALMVLSFNERSDESNPQYSFFVERYNVMTSNGRVWEIYHDRGSDPIIETLFNRINKL